jgi:hypothetical protein
MVAIGAEVFRLFSLPEFFVHLKEGMTDLASELSSFVPIVVVEIAMGSIATSTYKMFRYARRGWAILDGR